jgi:EpsI family protein
MKGVAARLAVVSAVLLLLGAWTHARPNAAGIERFDFETAMPLAFDEWIGRDAPPLEPEVARVLAADQYVHRYYVATNRASRVADRGERSASVEMDIAYYARPQAGAAMHSPLNCLPGNGWEIMESRTMPVTTAEGSVQVRRLVVALKGYRVAMTYWFQNRRIIVGNEYRQRFQFLANGLQGRPSDAALVRVMANDTTAGHEALEHFTRRLATMLNGAFR